MRLSVLFVFLLLSQYCSGQRLMDREIKLTQREGTTGAFLNRLDSVPGIDLSYSSAVVDLDRPVLLTGKEKTVEDYLQSILKGQAVRFRETNGKIFIIALEAVKKKFTISGYISSRESGERLIGASVYIPQKNIGTTSNQYGFYSITLDEDSVMLQVSHTGFFGFLSSMHLSRNIELDVALEQNVVQNQLVVINSESRKNVPSRSIGRTEIPQAFIKSLPSLMGEPDVLKTLQMLPGVQAGNEATSGLNVRGGSADQNLILLDGVSVYNASHAFGIFSIFNADAIAHVEILKSGFPASYGGRLSSVVNVHMKEGDKYKFHGEGGLGLIFSKLTLEGPLKKGKSSFMISGRRTYADLIIRPILKLSDATTDVIPFFADFNAKMNVPLGQKDRIYASLYMGKDKFLTETENASFGAPFPSTMKTTYGFSWGNVTAMTRWNHEFNNRTFSNFTLTHSRFRFDTRTLEEYFSQTPKGNYTSDQRYASSIEDWTVKGDIDYIPIPRHFVKTGFSATLHRYQPGRNHMFYKDTVVRIDQTIVNEALTSGEFDLYIDDDIRISNRMKINAGIRFTGFAVQGKFFKTVQPRLNWLYRLNEHWQLKASAGRMNQFIHLLTNSTLGLPTDLWLPVTDKAPPQQSNQVAAGITWRPDKSIEATMEVYYKSMKNVIEYTEGASFGSAFDKWEDLIERGKGKTWGAEWFVHKKKGVLTGIVSYTLSKSIRQFEGINFGRPFPYKYDRRHEIKTGLVWQPGKFAEISANWMFSSGNAISLPTSYYYNPYRNRYIDVYTERNNSRMPSYHRLDLSIKFIQFKKKHQKSWVISIHNVYNRFNPFFRYKIQFGDQIQFREVSVLPFMPSVAYQFKF